MTYCQIQRDIRKAADEADCPLVGRIAEGTKLRFDDMQGDLTEEEERLLMETVLRLFSAGNFREAISVLSLAFSLMGHPEAAEIISYVASSGDDYCARAFLAEFLTECRDELDAVFGER